MDEGVNDEFDDENRLNFIEENDTRVNGEDKYSKEVEEKEEDVKTDSEINALFLIR